MKPRAHARASPRQASAQTLETDVNACIRLAFAAVLLAPCAADAQSLPASASARFGLFDADGNGAMSMDEYKSALPFSQFDTDKDNRISATELQSIFGEQADGQPSAADHVRIHDENNDGSLTEEEFRNVLEARFRSFDKNDDESVDLAEMKAGASIL